MKKRRELDALVGNGKMNRNRSAKKTQELLLENMTDSSDIEEFNIQPSSVSKTVVRKRGVMHFCKSCFTICSFFMIIFCIIAIVCLILVFNDLKSELEKEKRSISYLSKKYDEDVLTLTSNIESINRSIAGFTTQLEEFKREIEIQDGNMPQLKAVKEKVDQLTNQIAQMGSNIETINGKQGNLDKKNALEKAAIDEVKNRTDNAINRLDLLELKFSSGNSEASTPSPVNAQLVHEVVASVATTISTPNKESNDILVPSEFVSDTTNKFMLINTSMQLIKEDLIQVRHSYESTTFRIETLENYINTFNKSKINPAFSPDNNIQKDKTKTQENSENDDNDDSASIKEDDKNNDVHGNAEKTTSPLLLLTTNINNLKTTIAQQEKTTKEVNQGTTNKPSDSGDQASREVKDSDITTENPSDIVNNLTDDLLPSDRKR